MIAEVIAGVAVILFVFYFMTRRPANMPPGEFGYPVIGFLPNDEIHFNKRVEILKKKHGKIFTWKMGYKYFVFMCDPKVIKTVFNNPTASHRPDVFSLDVFSEFKKLGFGNSSGPAAMNSRRFFLRYIKDHGVGKTSIEDVILFEVDLLLKEIKKTEGKPTEVPWCLNVAVINILWKILADIRYDVGDEKFQEFERLITSIFNDFQNSMIIVCDLFPIIARIPFPILRRFGPTEIFDRIDKFIQFFRDVMDDHVKRLDPENPRDFIDTYLIEIENVKNGRGTERTFNFTYKELLYSLADLFSAGSETVSSTIRWMILYMAKYPKVQEKVQREIDNVVPRDRLPSLMDKEKLNYTSAVILEATRLSPVAPVGAYHAAADDMTIEGFNIPKGTILVSGILSCHMDPDNWDNPKEFLPERFLNADGTLKPKNDGYLPFSVGKRMCPGEALSWSELFLFFSGLIQKYTISSSDPDKISMEPQLGKPLFLIPDPFEVVFTERK